MTVSEELQKTLIDLTGQTKVILANPKSVSMPDVEVLHLGFSMLTAKILLELLYKLETKP